MATINLLPWREEYRQRKKREFLEIAAAVLLLSLLALFLWDRVANSNIATQEDRNAVLQSEIDALEQKVEQIAKLKERRQQLLDRMTVIQSLQANRPEIVRVFDELAVAVPDGVYLASLDRNRENISMTGFAESNTRVSTFMRQLESSYKFTDPNLTSVEADDRMGEQGNTFDLRVQITEPEVVEKEEDGGEGA